MKAGTVAILLLASLSLALADDIRIVNGASVDLGPLHEWSSKKKGDRPMKHWKEILVVDIRQVGGVPHYAVEIEGRPTEIYIEHLPDRITRHFEQKQNLERQEDELRDYIQAEDRRIKDASAAAKTSAAKSGHRKVPASTKADTALAKNALEQKRHELSKISKELSALKKKQNDLVEFAMFTGRKYAGLDIWDCGRKE